MVPITRLLCPIDFSDASRHALDHALVIAQWYDATIIGLHVYNPLYVPVGGVDLPDDDGTIFASPAASSRLQLQLKDAFAPARASGVPLETVIEEGSPALQILHGVGAHRADLIVMGTHGAKGFERLLLGSITEKVVRKAGCPVLTVPPRAHATSRLPFRRILCPIDFLPASAAGLRFALSMAQEAEAELLLLHVLEWPIGHEPPPLPTFNVPEYRIYREREAAAELEQLVPSSARDWCEPSTHLVHGKPYEQVARVCRRSRGRSHRHRRAWPQRARRRDVRIDDQPGDPGCELPGAHDSAVKPLVAGGERVGRTLGRFGDAGVHLAVGIAAHNQPRVERVDEVERKDDAVAIHLDVRERSWATVDCLSRSHARPCAKFRPGRGCRNTPQLRLDREQVTRHMGHSRGYARCDDA